MGVKAQNITITVDGVRFVGPPEKIREILGDRYPSRSISGNVYFSRSKGIVPVKHMATAHLKNAYLLLTTNIVNELRRETDLATFIQKTASFETGCFFGDCTRKRMIEELYTRLLNGEVDFSEWHKG